MKKLISLLTVSVLLALAVLPFAFTVSAEEGETAMLWVTHYNTADFEGAGVIVTDEGYNKRQDWRLNISFAPVEGTEGVYEIVDIKNYLGSDANGVTEKAPVPEGGFLYQLNMGNDYTSTGGEKFTSDSCTNMIATAQQWQLADQFTFANLDLEGMTPSTTTPDLTWYNPDYVCTTTYTKVIPGSILPNVSDPTDDNSSAPEADVSVPADNSVADTSVPATDNSVADTSASAVSDTSAGNNDDGNDNTVWYIAAAAVAAVVVVVVVVVILKKKK